MPHTTCHMSISLDGFVVGPDQSREDPLGRRGRELHVWHLGDERANDADATATGWLMRPRGWAVLDLLITHETNGIRFTELDRQRLNRARYHDPNHPTSEEATAA